MNRNFEFNSNLLKNMNEYRDNYINEIVIYSVSTLKNPKDNTLIFVNELNKESETILKEIKNSIIILNNDDIFLKSDSNCLLYVDRPRREYARILDFILKSQITEDKKYILKDGYYIGENVSKQKKSSAPLHPFFVTTPADCA